jgi:alkanesulfonate monooxygenase SsuD/methylene tetrahydromethanopterin reductase-like flavin-dependent oxidoreductase (luciferase family)
MSFEPAPPTSPETLALTPAEATAKLAEMQAQLHPPAPVKPEDAQGARQRLGELSKDATWTKQLFAGDPAATKTFHELVALSEAGDVVGDRLAGIVEDPSTQPIFLTTVDGEWPKRVVTEVVSDLRSAGLDDRAINQAVNGGSVSLAEFQAARPSVRRRKP